MLPNFQKLFTFAKWLLIACFAGLIVFELFQISKPIFNMGRILCLLVLISIMLFKNRYTWFFGVAFFLFGLFEVVVIASRTSSISALDFTATLSSATSGNANLQMSRFLRALPALSYLLLFLLFTTTLIRKRYGILRKTPPKIKSYL